MNNKQKSELPQGPFEVCTDYTEVQGTIDFIIDKTGERVDLEDVCAMLNHEHGDCVPPSPPPPPPMRLVREGSNKPV